MSRLPLVVILWLAFEIMIFFYERQVCVFVMASLIQTVLGIVFSFSTDKFTKSLCFVYLFGNSKGLP